jgi:hypothetical protein
MLAAISKATARIGLRWPKFAVTTTYIVSLSLGIAGIFCR